MSEIPLYRPFLKGNEKKYVLDCLDSGWISSKGEFVNRFEKSFSDYTGIKYSATCSNGTCAIHLAFLALGIASGDDVIVPSFTYIATVNPIMYCCANPIFVDSIASTGQIDAEAVKKKLTLKTKAIIVPHLYGHSADMSKITTIAKEHNLFLIEDCAEALGTKYKGIHIGNFGDIATFSFYGNKTITTGEGGMVSTNNSELYRKICHFKGQGLASLYLDKFKGKGEYWHDIIGYNYRLTNVACALGLAQLEQIELVLKKKSLIAKKYRELLNGKVAFLDAEANTESSNWMVCILLKDTKEKIVVRSNLLNNGVETRPLFPPVHKMPPYNTKEHFPISEQLHECGINLPSYPDLTDNEITFISDIILKSI